MKSNFLIITTGDPDGIGLEVTVKALLKYNRPRHQRILVFASPNSEVKFLKILKRLALRQFSNLSSAFSESAVGPGGIFLVFSEDSPADWVVSAGQLCGAHPKLCALITAPLSKGLIRRAGFTGLGHTDLLADTTRVPRSDLFMGFVGAKFSVVLATGHIPIHKVESRLTAPRLQKALQSASRLRHHLTPQKRRLPLGLLGLNPHAGDDGLIGHFEKSSLEPLLRWAKGRRISVDGPLVPDAAFLPSAQQRHSVFVALYHDQGLIPFKAIHGANSGVHVTLGLPFIRTSVDHGTAKDIFGKNRAAFGSMLDALHFANKLLGVQK